MRLLNLARLNKNLQKIFIGLVILGLNLGSAPLVSATSSAVTNTDTSETFSNLQDAIDDSDTLNGHTLVISEDLYLSQRVEVDKDLTIDGSGFSLLPTFTWTSNSNNSSLVVFSDDTTIQNLTIDGVGGTDLHGINVYVADGVLLDNVTVINNDRTGVVVNGSSVTVNNISTSGNGWHAMNVDLGGGVTSPAVLTVTGYSAHTDTVHILVDDITKAVSVVDPMSQYSYVDYGNTRVYTLLDVIAPSTPQWGTIYTGHGIDAANEIGCGGYTNTPQVTFEWNENTESDLDGYWFGTKFNQKHQWFDAGTNVKTANMTPGNNPYYYTLIAVDTAGNESPVSAQCGLTLDQDAPDVFQVLPADGTVINGASITQSWGSTATDVHHYNYESYNDAAGTSLRWTDDFTATSKTATNVGEAEYWWRVQAVDMAGNTSSWSPLWKITVDNTAPVVDLTSHSNGDLVAGLELVSGTVTDDNNHHYWLVIQNSGGTTVAGPGVVNDSSSVNTPLLVLDTTTIPDGDYTIKLEARDAANNKDASSVEWVTVTVDNSAPVVDITAPTTGEFIAGAVDIVGSVVDGEMLSHYNMSLYPSTTDLSDGQTHSSQRLNDSNWCTTPTSGTVVLSANFTGNLCTAWDTTAYPDGSYQIRLAARDAASNRDTGDPFTGGTSSVHVVAIAIDNTDPIANAGADAGDQTASFGHSGAASDAGSGIASTTWTAVSGPGTVTISDSNTLTPTLSASTAGDYVVKLVVVDNVGNSSEDTFAFTWVVPAPVAPVITPQAAVLGTTDVGSAVGAAANSDDPSDDEYGEELVAESGSVSSQSSSNSGNVLAETDANEAPDGCTMFLGLCWYWWLLTIPLVAVWWYAVSRESDKKKK